MHGWNGQKKKTKDLMAPAQRIKKEKPEPWTHSSRREKEKEKEERAKAKEKAKVKVKTGPRNPRGWRGDHATIVA